jgi:hypothetical protein
VGSGRGSCARGAERSRQHERIEAVEFARLTPNTAVLGVSNPTAGSPPLPSYVSAVSGPRNGETRV